MSDNLHPLGLHSRILLMQVFEDIPFSDKTEYQAAKEVLGGNRPTRPTHPFCTDVLWDLMEGCWAQEPRSRPTASEVLRTFHLPAPAVKKR